MVDEGEREEAIRFNFLRLVIREMVASFTEIRQLGD